MSFRPPLFLLLLLLTACNRNSDAQLQAKLPGVWQTTESQDGDPAKGQINATHTSTFIVAPDGKFDCVAHSTSRTDGSTWTNNTSGTWEVRNGLLIDTITRGDNTNAPLPVIWTLRILRADDKELVLKYEPGNFGGSPTNELVLHKLDK